MVNYFGEYLANDQYELNLPEDGSPEDIMDHWICHMWLLYLMCLLAFWSYLIKVAVEYTEMSSSGRKDDI